MTFARPELLALGPVVVLLASLAITSQWRRSIRLMEAYGGALPARRMSPRDLRAYPVARLTVVLLAGLCLVVAATEPSRVDDGPVSESPIDLVVALDISLSMSAEDVGSSSRSARAVEVLAALTDALPEEHIGVAVFADWPYTLVPVTHDLDVVRFFGETVGPQLVSDRDQGTGLGAVVTHARSTLESRRREGAEPAILVLTDGESLSDAAAVLDSVAAATLGGVRLWTGGVGTTGGAPLPRPGSPGDVLVDETGAPVVTALDDDLLRQMAGVGGGAYYDVSRDGGMRALLSDMVGESRESNAPNRGPGAAFWLSLIALALLAADGVLDSSRLVRRTRQGGVR